MKTLKQLGIILTILWAGKAISDFLKLPIPGTVMGMIILLLFLLLRIVSLSQIKDITVILLENLSLLFIPAGVGIINEFSGLRGSLIKLSVILFVTMVIVMVVTGKVVQFLVNNKKGREII